MLMVPVAHFWTSASGRDTVTSWADLTVTAPVNSWPSTLMVRSAENPWKSAGQRAVFSNACRNRSRARGSSWASVGHVSLLDIMVMGSLLESHYRYPSAVRPDLFYFHQLEKFSSCGTAPSTYDFHRPLSFYGNISYCDVIYGNPGDRML